jgi:hypothetical protein
VWVEHRDPWHVRQTLPTTTNQHRQAGRQKCREFAADLVEVLLCWLLAIRPRRVLQCGDAGQCGPYVHAGMLTDSPDTSSCWGATLRALP